MQNTITWLMEKIYGKKTTLFTILGLTNNLLSVKGVYDEVTAVYFALVLVALGAGANVTTNKLIVAGKMAGKK